MITNLKTSHFLSLLFFFVIAMGFSACNKETIPEKPNILFIFGDDHAFEAIHAWGNTEVQTPNLDKLTEAGVSFTNTYNMGAWHGAVCVASRAMINSGLTVWRAKEAETTFGQRASDSLMWGNLMTQAGYDTYFTGKWHVKVGAKECFTNVGKVRPGMPNQTKEGYNRPLSPADTTWTPWDKQYDGYWKGGTHWSEIVGDEAIGFLEQAKESENPFFMYIAFNAPHDPRQAPKEYVDMYPVESIKVPESYLPLYPEKDSIGCGEGLRDEKLAPFPRTHYAVQVNRQEYYAIISHMDTQIGRIIDALKESGKADNTYIFYSADHGLAVGHHGLIGKQNMYEHSVKPPMIVIGPDIPKNKKNEGFVYLQDIMASSLELAGIEKPEYVEFRTLLPMAKGSQTESNYESVYGCYMNLQRMVRKGDKKLIVYPKVPKAYLFDLEKDPLEMLNLADDEKYSDVKSELFEELFALQEKYGDDLVINRDDY